mgnify:CR=1 FL=1
MGAGDQRPSIPQFYRQIGAKTLTAFRNNRFSWTSTKRDGTAILSRLNWLNVASGGMDTATAPATLSGQQVRAIGGATRMVLPQTQITLTQPQMVTLELQMSILAMVLLLLIRDLEKFRVAW